MGKRLRHGFTKNLQIQTYTLIGIHLQHLHGTLKTLTMRASKISSNNNCLKLELKHLPKVFHERNGYPHWFITKVMNEVKRSNIPRENENRVTSKRTLILPYAAEKGCQIVIYLEKQLRQSLPDNLKPNIVFTGA